ncbi:MAG: hypothetical protein FWD97_08780 [Defluviitaleaceae bacterium]|nr:hypothetical protein [Defluviitaleaceae bacterium]
MKRLIMHILATTGLSLVIVATIIVTRSYLFIIPFAGTVLPVFFANILIHAGLFVTGKFESRYWILESLLDVTYIATVIIIFGWQYNWFSLTPIWSLILMAVFMYIVGLFLRMARIRGEVNEINKLLEKRNKK